MIQWQVEKQDTKLCKQYNPNFAKKYVSRSEITGNFHYPLALLFFHNSKDVYQLSQSISGEKINDNYNCMP